MPGSDESSARRSGDTEGNMTAVDDQELQRETVNMSDEKVTELVEGDVGEEFDPVNEVQGIKLALIHLSICLCTLLIGLDFNMIATAIPVITAQFNSTRDIGWYGAGFMIALCATQPLAGKTYTIFPQKTIYLLYLLLFEVGSLICATAPSSRALIAGRVIAGAGASGVFAGGFAIIASIVPLHKRAMWIGLMGSTFSIASIIGPVIGGALAQNVSWRWCFYLNLPIGGAAAVVFFLLVRLEPIEGQRRPLSAKLKSLDFVGFAILAGSITMLLLALQWAGITYAWSSSVTIGLLVGFAVGITSFLVWNVSRGEDALVPPKLFSMNRNPALLCAAAFFINGPFQIIIYWLPVWFQGVLGSSPIHSGVNFLPTVIADVVAAFLGAALVTQIGWWNPFLLFAEAMVCVGGGLLTTIYPNVSGSHWIGYQILGGVGYSLASNLSHIAMQSSLPQNLASLGSSTLLALISTSCAIFNAVGQAVFQQRLHYNLDGVVPSMVINEIINSGVTNVTSLLSKVDVPLSMAVDKYSLSITQTFYITAISPAISFGLLLGCKWFSTKKDQKSVDSKRQVA